MMACLEKLPQRAGVVNYLSHEILSVLWLRKPVSTGEWDPRTDDQTLDGEMGEATAAAPGVAWRREQGQGQGFTEDVQVLQFAAEASEEAAATACVYFWPVAPELGVAMALGTWTEDVTIVIRRHTGQTGMPTRAALLTFKSSN